MWWMLCSLAELAAGAGSEEEDLVARHRKAPRKHALEPLDAAPNVEGLLADRAEEVVMMLAAGGFVANGSAGKLDCSEFARVEPCLERAVDRRDSHSGVSQFVPQLVGRAGATRVGEALQDELVSRGLLYGIASRIRTGK